MPLKELADNRKSSTARRSSTAQDNSRYIGVQYSVEGRDLASAVQDAQAQVDRQVKMPPGYRAVWGGEYEEYTASRTQLQSSSSDHDPAHLLLLFLLYSTSSSR